MELKQIEQIKAILSNCLKNLDYVSQRLSEVSSKKSVDELNAKVEVINGVLECISKLNTII